MYFTSHSNKRFDIQIGTGTIWHLIYAYIILCKSSLDTCTAKHHSITDFGNRTHMTSFNTHWRLTRNESRVIDKWFRFSIPILVEAFQNVTCVSFDLIDSSRHRHHNRQHQMPIETINTNMMSQCLLHRWSPDDGTRFFSVAYLYY